MLARHQLGVQQMMARRARHVLIVGRLPEPNTGGGLSTYWLSAEARLSSRLLISRSSPIPTIANHLIPGESPYKLWIEKGRPASQARAYVDLALIDGDLAAAYEIVRENHYSTDDRKDWLQYLTNTIWQTAVEAAHELDFDRAKLYSQLYLVMSQLIYTGAASMQELGPERNRTLAHILLRETTSGRISSLCREPGVKRSFGRLLGGDSGYALPADDPKGLQERRSHNTKQFCASQAQNRVNYASLEALEALSRITSNEISAYTKAEESEACTIARLECDFVHARDDLEPPVTGGAANRALDFSARCSYLSDDLLYILFAVNSDEDANSSSSTGAPTKLHAGTIDIPSLRAALRCVDRDASDYRELVRQRITATACSSFRWNGVEIAAEDISQDESIFRALVTRCRR